MGMANALSTLTVVVPVGPGDAMSPRLRAQLDALPAAAQVRVVHADAVPASADTATQSPPRGGPRWETLAAQRGRASQQNAGAHGAVNAWLWFLHADCELAPDSLRRAARFIDRGGDAWGYFDLRFLDDGPALTRLNAVGAWLRSRCLHLPFGDQGLLLPRTLFERIGGFDVWLQCGEDHDLVWRLRRAGVAVRPVGAPLFTSARKYAVRGWWPTTAWHLRETLRQPGGLDEDGESAGQEPAGRRVW